MFKAVLRQKYILALVAMTGLIGLSSWAEEKLFYPSSEYNDVSISRASWIWYPEKFSESGNQTRFFRKGFKLEKVAESAKIHIRADDGFTLKVNEREIEKSQRLREGDDWRSTFSFNIKDFLRAGENNIAIDVNNGGGPGGLICRAEIKTSDKTTIDLTSDKTWQVSKDNQKWFTPRVIGDVTAAPWGGGNITSLLTHSELRAYQETERITDQKLTEIEHKLLDEQKPTSRITYKNGTPFITIGEKTFNAVMYKNRHLSPDDPKFIRKIKAFKDSGSHFFAFDLDIKNCWLSPDKIHIPDWNKNLLKILEYDPDAHFMIGISLVPPKWWLQANSEELIGYATGEPSFKASVFQRIVAASYASEKWRLEVGEVLDKIMRYFDDIPAGRRIFAYRLDYGIYAEWHYFGMKADMPDTGKAMTAAFRTWLRKRYINNIGSLRKAWNDKNVTFATATVPDHHERSSMGMLALRDPVVDQKVIDYQYCHQDVVGDCQLHFNGIARNATQGRALIGNYSGYFFGVNYPAEAWHLETERVLDSPVTDFQVSPYCYSPLFRSFGYSAQVRAIAGMYRIRDKLCILEADTRTHLNETSGQHHAESPDDSIALLSRDFCNALVNGIGMWYFDFGYNWYDHPQIYSFMKQTKKIMDLKADNNSSSEVAVVCDFESVIFHSSSTGYSELAHSVINRNIAEIAHSGVPYDTVSITDLGHENIKDYKVYLFLNLFYLTPEKRVLIDRLKKQAKVLVWFYAPGFINSNGLSSQGASELIGMNIKHLPKCEIMQTRFLPVKHTLTEGLQHSHISFKITDGPLFYVDDPQAVGLGEFLVDKQSLISLAVKKSKNFTAVYSAMPFMSRTFLRNVYKMAGVHIYNEDNNDVIYVNNSFLAVHTKSGGRKVISFPEKTECITQMLPVEKSLDNDVKKLIIETPPNSTMLLHFKY